jgi:hypothetical protein
VPRSVDAQGISTPSTNNSNLSAAKKAKNDEFYTQWVDIEKEMNAYLDYDPDVFRDKTILLPCDDPNGRTSRNISPSTSPTTALSD